MATFAGVGMLEHYNGKLAKLADLAQDEIWSFGKDKDKDPYRILIIISTPRMMTKRFN